MNGRRRPRHRAALLQRKPAARVPAFGLYGEAAERQVPAVESLHVESIRSRSSLYRWEIAPHVHAGLHQILWLGRGAAAVDLDETHIRVEAPAAIVIPPRTVHAFRFRPGSDGFVLTMNLRTLLEGEVDLLGAALRSLFRAPACLPMAPEVAEVARIEALFATLLAEFNAPQAAGGPLPLWLARCVVWALAQAASRHEADARASRSAARALFTRFVVLVEAHYLEHWPMARYAAQLGLSAERLNRLVRAEVDRTALGYVHARLAREASRRLVYLEAPVSGLAYELGFADAAYFCRFFKRITGLAPSQYRTRHRRGEGGAAQAAETAPAA